MKQFCRLFKLTPYNPDWAVLVELDGTERLNFVVETKGSLFINDQNAKIKCGAHFEALAVGDSPARFVKATKLDDVWRIADDPSQSC